MAGALTDVLQAANKHPNSRVSKLIHTVEEEPNQKNIVLLLIELAEHAEYSIDFKVSLKYYLDLFERLGIDHDLVLNEAGLLLVNTSKIYSKRVDYVHSLVERQILTLSNADDELQKQKLAEQQTENAPSAEKPKRGRKRALETPSDPYEVELVPKKFKRLTEEKRFSAPKSVLKTKPSRNIEMEQHIHPAGWQHAAIYDFENEEDVDTKRNYKLYTYHVEHRYNTLVPDINFRLHFKVKDYMDEQEEMEEDEACNTDRSWPPLSEAYVQKYLRLENYVLQQDMQTNKRKTVQEVIGTHAPREKQGETEVVSTDPADESQKVISSNANNVPISGEHESELLQSSLNSSIANSSSSSESTKLPQDLESSNINEKNDSGLGQSILDETNNTLDNTQLNCTLESSTVVGNVNNSISPESNKCLNTPESKRENEDILGVTVLDQSGNTEIIKENGEENLNRSTSKDSESKLTGIDISLNITESQQENDSTLNTSILEQTDNTVNNTTIEPSRNMETTKESICETIAETSALLETFIISTEEFKQVHVEDIPALTDDQQYLVSSENLAKSSEILKINDDESEIKLNVDIDQNQNKDPTQIHVHLPCVDDEGVYLSDLEDDCRLLSTVIKAPNILPGVERKDITIIMDDELREALEMRDGIMEHFGRQIYKVPVITQERKQNLVFNILKLPEKLLRRKVLFKLGPDMDLYLQSRSLKRCRPEHVARVTRCTQLMQWFSLNNTDMSGVCMTPPNSPGHSTVFCGFSDTEDDTVSSLGFHGFTEEEQSTLMSMKNICRLSRDSGVGVDVNNLTMEKETGELIFQEGENSATNDDNKNDNSDTTESILSQLPAEIRDVLTTELAENNGAITVNTESCTSLSKVEETEEMCIERNGDISDNLSTVNCNANNEKNYSETTGSVMQSNSIEIPETVISENALLSNTQESDVLLTETAIETCTAQSTTLPSNSQQTLGNNEELTKEKLDVADSIDHFEDHHQDAEIHNCDDDAILDLDTQGNKTKIQQWHEQLQPILAKSRERHHFDVYKLGTEILDTVQSKERTSIDEPLREINSDCTSSINSAASFHEIMENKDKSYVSRYFLSTLLLANQSNIEISIHNKSAEEPTSWHDMNLKLISTKRHTVAIEDNIGMIDKKQNARDKNRIQNSKKIENKTANRLQNQDEEEEEPLIKLLSMKKASKNDKTSLKRFNDNPTISCLAEKKSKEIIFSNCTTNDRPKETQNLIKSVQSIIPPFVEPLPAANMSMMPSTSRQAQKINTDLLNSNSSTAIRTLQPIEKVQTRNDDHDSGIFSIGEMSTS